MKAYKAILVGLALLFVSAMAFADTDDTTLSWVIPASVSHTLSYGGSCSSSAMYFIENDASPDGTDTQLIPYDAASAGSVCQSSGVAAITITNNGNVTTDVNASVTSTLESGVTLKLWLGSSGCGASGLGGYEASCSATGMTDATVPSTSTCVSVGDTTRQVVADLAASGSQQLCLAADFTGLSQGTTTDTFQTNGYQSAG